MAPSSKPETVLKQAEGLVSVGQTHAALSSLTEMFSSKKFRSTPLTSLEPVIHRFIELCVDLRKGRTAKEGLMQYKNIAQNTSVQSIEAVITRFVQLADAKVQEAQEKAQAATAGTVDIDDLEASETPESILLGAVSGDQSKDRTDRALVTPWLKFLWESYRTSLETLKNNARLETIYQQIAQQAFKFCLKHQRKVEFRRLCETLRLHLANVAKYSHQAHSINLSDPDILQHHLDTRFAQLNTSVELELWQEAFRSVEDVHNLLTLAKKAPRPAMMANYYEKLTKIFLMSGNALYHAAAWGRYYGIVTSIGGKSEEELSRLAGQVLVSALAVPVGLQSLEEPEELKGKNARLSALLGLTKMPTRAGLLKDALARDVLKLSPPSVKKLYDILEVTFNPLTLCSSIAPLLASLSTSEDPSYGSYLPLLHQALLSRLLSHLSQIYSSIKVSNLLALAAPLKDANVEGAYDAEQIEAYVMGCARRGELNVRVDHLEGCIVFVDEAFGSTSSGASGSVQPTTAELIHSRLGNVATTLYNSVQIINPTPVPTEEEAHEKLQHLLVAVEAEREALRIRRALVARRRELITELTARKEKEESNKRAEIVRREREEESRRKAEESRLKEIERNKAERETIRITEAKKYAQSLMDMGVLKSNDVDKMENIDTEELISMQVQHIEKEKKDLTLKTRIISKRVDHQVRAYRKEEAPLLAQDYEQQQKVDRETFDALQKSSKETALATHKDDLATKARLARMTSDYTQRKSDMLAKKGEDFAKKLEASKRKIAEEKAKRKQRIMQEREEERLRYEEEDRIAREREEEQERLEQERLDEEERQRAEAEAAAAAEEAKKREAEEKAAETRKQRDAERAEAMEQARMQQKREEEAEARRAARAAERNKPAPPAAAASPASRIGGGESAWRRKTPTSSTPGTPVRAANGLPSESAPAAAAPPASRPSFTRGGAPGGGGGGWREREAAAKAAAGGGSPTATPPRVATPTAGEEARGTPPAGRWGSSRLAGRGRGV